MATCDYPAGGKYFRLLASAAAAFGVWFSARATPVQVNDTDSSITYTSGWVAYSDGGLIDGNGHHNTNSGDYCQYTFTAASIKWIGATNTGLGAADVYIDGVYDVSVTQAASSLQYGIVNYQKTWSTSGSHTIKIVGTSSAPVVVDAFSYDTTASTVGANLALSGYGGVASASSSHSSGSFPVSSLNDNGTSTYWNDGTQNTFPDTCSITWNCEQTVNEVVLRLPVMSGSYTLGERQIDSFQVQYKDRTGVYRELAQISGWMAPATNDGTQTRALRFPTVSTREIRLYFTGGNSDGWSYMEEIQVYNQDLAIGANGGSPDASSAHSSGLFPIARLNDNDSNGYWNDGTQSVYPDTCSVTWASAQTINRVVLRLPILSGYPLGDRTLGAFTLQYKSGSSYVNLQSFSSVVTPESDDGTQNLSVAFSAVSTTEIRVSFSSGNSDGWSYMEEIEAFDDTGVTLPAVVAQQSLPGTNWTLDTSTTDLTLAILNNRPTIFTLKNPSQNWNWTATQTSLPLLGRVYIGATAYAPNWTYQDATVDTTSGTKVTLRFTSTTPSLELKSIWWARPGVGPVEVATTVQNNTGSTINYNDSDVATADLTFTADAPATIWHFDKVVSAGGDRYAAAPVKSQLMNTANSSVQAYTDNSYGSVSDIPVRDYDVNSVHGLYIGYMSSFGKASDQSYSNPLTIEHKDLIWDTGSFNQANGVLLSLPSFFIGTYQGDLDAGGNTEKAWYWNYKLPATMRANSNEPLVEYCTPDTEAGNATFYSTYPSGSFGGELAKEDINWLNGSQVDWFGSTIMQWNPDPSTWPDGMQLGTLVHSNGLKLALYMPHSYEGADLSTSAGVTSEESALLTRFDNYPYDYYRSDFVVEGSYDFLKHQGFMSVLDYMIANRSGFRYEHCSAGGTLKDFDTLQRITFMTTDDSATMNGHKQSYFSSSYFINPVQLKSDVLVTEQSDLTLINYYLRLGLIGASMMSPLDTTKSGDARFIVSSTLTTAYKNFTTLYQNTARPVLRGASVFHVLPIVSGSDWDGFELFNSNISAGIKGYVVLWKPVGGATSRTIHFKGLNPTTTYSLTFQDRPTENTSATGATLMTTGLTVTGLTDTYSSEIIWIQ